jgi:hypothetical protein
MPPLDNQVHTAKTDNTSRIYFWVGLFAALIPLGLQLIGISINVWLGGIVMAAAFVFMVRAFWVWERSARWHKALRATTVLVAGLIYFRIVGHQMLAELRKEGAASMPNPLDSAVAWLAGPHGRWFDKVLGGAYMLAFILGLIFLAALGRIIGQKKPQTGKGFLDYKLQAEKAIVVLPVVLEPLTKIMSEVGLMLDKQTKVLQGAKTTDEQLKVIKYTANSLDAYLAA